MPNTSADGGRPEQEHRQRRAAAPHLDEQRGERVAGQLGKRDHQRELERADQAQPGRDEQRGQPDERPVVGEVHPEPHQPERGGAQPGPRLPQRRRPGDRFRFAGGRRRRRRAEPRRILEPAHGGLRLGHATSALEEPDRLRQPEPDRGGVQRGHRAKRQRPAPAVVGQRDHEVADQRGQQPADGPERLEHHDDPAADPGRGELADQRRRDRELRAQTETDHEPKDEQGRDRPGERGGSGGQAVHQQRDRKDLAPADPVRQQPAEARADRHPDEPDRGHPRQRRAIQSPLHRQRGHHEADQSDVHRVERPTDPGDGDQPAMLPGERQPVEALAPAQPGVREGGHGAILTRRSRPSPSRCESSARSPRPGMRWSRPVIGHPSSWGLIVNAPGCVVVGSGAGVLLTAPRSRGYFRPRIRSAARSAMAMVAAFTIACGNDGITDASTTRRPWMPRTRNARSTTAPSSVPIRQVPTG